MQSTTKDDDLQSALHADPAQLTHPIKDIKEKWKLVPAFLKVCADDFVALQLPHEFAIGPLEFSCTKVT
jgi:hypothetical protein